jgi:hypothetical protein
MKMLQALIDKVKKLLTPVSINFLGNEELREFQSETWKWAAEPLPMPKEIKQEEKPFYHPWHILSVQEKLMRILDRDYQAMDENSYKSVSLLSRYQDWQKAKTNEQRKMYFEILEDAVEYYLYYH